MNKDLIRKSKYISKLLRHNPEDLQISKDGYVQVTDLLKKVGITMTELEQICDENDKKRFEFDQYKKRIKARQGHSNKDIAVELYECTPEDIEDIEILYHVPGPGSVGSILKTGLNKMNRHHVHMSADKKMIYERGCMLYKNTDVFPVIEINAKELIKEQKIYRSNNNVYLTDNIDKKFIYVSEIRK